MCRGREEEERSQGNLCLKEAVSVSCDLCNSEASLYCQADDAYLCQKCDKWVHGANFLAQRHIRCLLCNTCRNLTHRYLIGAGVEVVLPIIVNWPERRVCSSNDEEEPHGTPKMPFLFL